MEIQINDGIMPKTEQCAKEHFEKAIPVSQDEIIDYWCIGKGYKGVRHVGI